MGPEGPPESLPAGHLSEEGCYVTERPGQGAPTTA